VRRAPLAHRDQKNEWATRDFLTALFSIMKTTNYSPDNKSIVVFISIITATKIDAIINKNKITRGMRHRFSFTGFCLLFWATNPHVSTASSANRRSLIEQWQEPGIVGETRDQTEAVTLKRFDKALDEGSRQRGRRRMRGSLNKEESKRRLDKGGGKGAKGSSSSGASGASSGSSGGSSSSLGGSGGLSGSGVGWDANGNYCGCLCDGSWSSNAEIACEYAVHSETNR
jgi:uncharacterized membrane protein YgcG